MPRKNKNRGRKDRKDRDTTRSTLILISYPRISIEHESQNSFLSIATNGLSIVEFKDGNNGEVKTFLEAGTILYELICGVTSYSRLEKVFILSNHIKGTRVKLVFPHGIPNEYCDNFYQVLQDTLKSSEIEVINTRSSQFHATEISSSEIEVINTTSSQFRATEIPSSEVEVINTTSSQFHATGGIRTNELTVFDCIVQGSEFLAQGLVSGAEGVSKIIDHGTPALIDTIIPEEKPTEVDPAIRVGLNVAKSFTQELAVASQIRTSSTAAVATGIGQFLAPHIRKLGTEVLTSDYGYSTDEAEQKVEKALEITAGVATGIATLFDGFMSACSILGDSISRNAVEVVKHKYGDAAADATNDALGIVANVASTRMNEKRRLKRGIAIQAASGIYPVND